MLYAKPAIVLKNLCATVSLSNFCRVRLKDRDSLSKQIENANTFHHKPNKRPPHQDQEYARPERSTTSPFLLSCKEQECSLWSKKKCYADKKEDVTHGKKGAVEEEDQTEEQEEDTCREH